MRRPLSRAFLVGLAAWAVLSLGFTFGVRAQAAEKASLRLDWIIQANVAAFYYGLDRGFYKAQGIDLTIYEGKGSSLSAKLVAQKKDTFGLTDVGVAVRSIELGLPIKIVWCYFQQTPISVLSLAKNPIREPKDLIGKKVVSSAGSSMTNLFDPLLKRNGIDRSKVELFSSDPPFQPLLMAGRVDAMLGYWMNNRPMLEEMGAKVVVLKFYDWGMNVLSNGVTAHHDTIAAKPDLIRGFIRASMQSWNEAQKNPEAAIDSLMKRMLKAKRETQLKTLENAFQVLRTRNTQGKPLGWMSPQDWKETVDTLSETGLLKTRSPIDRYYTNEFIPGS